MAAPMSNIYICDVPLSNRYEHTYYFADVMAQREFFESKVIKTFSDYSFLRQTWSIKVQATLAQARPWSYLFTTTTDTGFRNYYFITRSEYINDNTTELFLELDVMQTYQHYTSLTECFVEREHPAIDFPGSNTVEESLEFGELVDHNTANVPLGELCIMVASTLDLELTTGEMNVAARGGVYDSQFSGLNYYAVDLADLEMWQSTLHILDSWGKSDCIVSMWMYPKKLITLDGTEWGESTFAFHRVSGTVSSEDISLYMPDKLGTVDQGYYTPRNQKLFTYPYCMVYLTNNTGGTAAYRFERFKDEAENKDVRFRIAGALSPDGGARMYPLNYEGTMLNYKAGIDLGGFPTCAWNQDVYKLWLAQTQNTRHMANISAGVTVAGGVFATVAGALTLNANAAMGGIATAVHGGLQIGNLLAQKQDKSIEPAQAKGATSASVAINAGFGTFTTVIRTIDSEHAKILDDYFDMYGYKTLLLKVPERNHRPVWWYTKTIGCNVVGQACADDKRKMAEIYDKGITFWADPNNMGNYSMDNTVT